MRPPRTGAVLTFLLAVLLGLVLPSHAFAQSTPSPCARTDGTALRDVHWRDVQPAHPLIGAVHKGDGPIAISDGTCARSPLQQLIVEVWQTIRVGGVVLLGEVHDNPEHHAVRGDILWPRLEPHLDTRDLQPAALFEHIRTSQQSQIDHFYAEAAGSRRLWEANDLLRELKWDSTGWPPGEIFQPLFQAALWAKLPVLPATPVRERMRTLVRDKSQATGNETALLGLVEKMPSPLLDALAAELEGSHCGMIPASAVAPMSLAQRYIDAHMAEALAGAAAKHGGAFLLTGNGHVRTDRAVPWYVRQLAPARKVLAVVVAEVEDGKTDPASYMPRAPDGSPAADYVLFTPRHDRPDPCEKMRQGKR